jgi:hypothetical protein
MSRDPATKLDYAVRDAALINRDLPYLALTWSSLDRRLYRCGTPRGWRSGRR